MPVTNNFIPSLMPAPAKLAAPVQPSQPVRAVNAEPNRDSTKQFANALDERVQANKAADRKDAQARQGNDPSAQATPGTAPSEVEETQEADAGTVADQAQLAQITAALFAAFGNTTPTAAPAASTGGTSDTTGDGIDSVGLAGVQLPADGKALPATADPAATETPTTTIAPTALNNANADAKSNGAQAATTTAANNGHAQPIAIATDKPGKADLTADALHAATTTAKAASDASIQLDASPQASQSMHNAFAARTPEPPRTEAPQFAVRTPVNQPGWSEDLGNRMVWMAGKELGRAELILTPPHLGRVEISLSMNGDQTSATFVTATPAARDAIEQSLPRLRELMTEAGLNLGQVNVSANNGRDPSQERSAWGNGSQTTGTGTGKGDDGAIIATGSRAVWTSGLGMIDTFA